jgi:hypothetical protein
MTCPLLGIPCPSLVRVLGAARRPQGFPSCPSVTALDESFVDFIMKPFSVLYCRGPSTPWCVELTHARVLEQVVHSKQSSNGRTVCFLPLPLQPATLPRICGR